MLSRTEKDIKKQADRIAAKLKKSLKKTSVETIPGFSQMGSGSLPTQNLPTTLIVIKSEKKSAESLASELRNCDRPIFARIHDDKVVFDPRTLLDDDEKILTDAVINLLDSGK